MRVNSKSKNKIPKLSEYNFFLQDQYKLVELKHICRHYKQKVSGKKTELMKRLYTHLKDGYFACKIQKLWRNHILHVYNCLKGPARMNRSLSVNNTDFLTMDALSFIPYSQLFSYMDSKGQIWCFDILSIFNLLEKNAGDLNPYNRQKFPLNMRHNMKRLIRLSRFCGDRVNVVLETEAELPIPKQIESRTVSLFSDMDELGNITDVSWFSTLGRASLILFIRELADIWVYRAQLTNEIKLHISPPLGNPFRHINLHTLPNLSTPALNILSLTVMDLLINRSANNSNRVLGANYVLCALTLVNHEAANSMPWLYQSVSHANV